MKKTLAVVIAIAVLIGWTAAPSLAFERGGGVSGHPGFSGRPGFHGFAPRAFPGPHRVFAAPHGVDGRHFGHPGFFRPGFHRGFGGPRVFFYGGVPYYYPYYYPYYAYADPPAVYTEPPTYTAPAAQYWYYCQDPQGYYPTVPQCPGGWLQVAPTPSQ